MSVQRRQVTNLLGVLERVREIHGDIPVQQLITLLVVAMNEGESQQQIQKLSKQSKASTSRNLQAWTAWTRHKEAGPGYIETREDPYERRRKLVYLTKQGEAFLNKVLK